MPGRVPYIPLPAPVEALAAGALRLPPDHAGDRDIRILPGLANRDSARPDVMRGEETQLLGLVRSGHQGLICMPGTHCKWAELRGGAVTGFQASRTGELFQRWRRKARCGSAWLQMARSRPPIRPFCARFIRRLAIPPC